MSVTAESIEAFIPLYPDISEPDFTYQMSRKKEFQDLYLESSEPIPESGEFLQTQQFMKRFFSPETPYTVALVAHLPGTGKCVHPSTLIPTNNGVFSAEELWENYNSILHFHDSEGTWSPPSSCLKISAYDENSGLMVQAPIKFMYKQFIDEKIVQLQLNDGSEIMITQQHHLYDGVNWIKDFEEGKFICVPEILRTEKKNITMDLAYVLGWQIAEGHERDRDVTVTQADMAILINLKTRYESLFKKENIDANVYIRQGSGGRCPYIQISSVIYQKYLESLGYIWGKKSAEKDIPNFIVNANENAQKTFLRAYFDGDGTVDKGTVTVTSASLNTISKLGIMLRSFGLWLRTRKMYKCATNGTRIKRLYYLGTLSRQDSIKYKHLIGFSIKYKMDAIHETGMMNTNVHVIPCGEILKEFKAKTNIPYHQFIGSDYIYKGKCPSRATLEGTCSKLENYANTHEEYTEECAGMIKKLRKIKDDFVDSLLSGCVAVPRGTCRVAAARV